SGLRSWSSLYLGKPHKPPLESPVRSQILFPLFAAVTSLPGIGPRFGKLLEGLCGPHVADLLWHRPSGLIDRRFHPKFIEAPAGVVATLTVTVDAHVKPYNPRQPYRV